VAASGWPWRKKASSDYPPPAGDALVPAAPWCFSRAVVDNDGDCTGNRREAQHTHPFDLDKLLTFVWTCMKLKSVV